MRVGLIGCGRWGRHILRDLLHLGCEVPVLARTADAVVSARDGGATAIVGTIAELAGVGGVVVATPTSTHAAVVSEALSLGVPIFVEKPLTSDPAAARELAARAGGALFVMDKWRYHAGVGELARIARDGSLGSVLSLHTIRVGWERPHLDVDGAWTLAPHDLSIALEILGAVPRPVAAAGFCLDGGTTLHALLEVGPVPHVLEVSERSAERRRVVALHCAQGVAILGGGWEDHVTVHAPDGSGSFTVTRVETRGELPLLAELRAFVEHLAGGPPPRSSAEDGAAIVAAIAELRALAGIY